MKVQRLVIPVLAFCLGLCALSGIATAAVKPDFSIETFIYNASGDNFTVRVRNNNPSAQYEGNVTFGIWLNNTLVTSSRTKYLYFNDNDAFDVMLFSSTEFVNQVNLSGNVVVKVKVDYNNNVLETNENNNTKVQTFIFNPTATAVSDLAVTAIYKVGVNQVKYTVKNAHPQNPFSGVMKINWSVNEGSGHTWMTTLDNLHAGHSKDFAIPYTLQPGRNAIQIKVDPNNQIAETNENNNSKLVYLYPSIAEIELMKSARLGYQSTRRTITQNTNPALITPNTIGPATSATNREMHIEVKLRGLGSETIGSYTITVFCYVPASTLRTYMPATFSNGPVNGDIHRRDITFWVPKSGASGNQSGKLKIILSYLGKTKAWEFPIQFSDF
jgi:hypothetical protein